MAQPAPHQVYYYRSGVWYELGEIVRPGNWGRVIRAYGSAHDLFFHEYVFETIREAEFVDRPSRMEAGFAFFEEQAARAVPHSGWPLLYQVRPTEPTAPRFVTDMSWLDGVRTFDDVIVHARGYWQGKLRGGPIEVVTMSPLEVVARLGFP